MTRTTSISVIGAGAWGTAVANLLAGRWPRVYLWAAQPGVAEEIRRTGCNGKYLPGVRLPAAVIPTSDPTGGLLESELFVWAIPVPYLRQRSRTFAAYLGKGAVCVNLGKGIEEGSWARPSEILAQELDAPRAVGSLVGPNIAAEVAAGMYTEAALGLSDERLMDEVADGLATDSFRIHTTPDLAGIELDAALKNVCAIAAGVCDGLGLGANMKGLVIANCLDEMHRVATVLGAAPKSPASGCSIGDLLASCYSAGGRNRRVGEYLARGQTLDEAITLLEGRVSEGVATCRACHELQARLGLSLPIAESLHDLIEGRIDPHGCISRILAGGVGGGAAALAGRRVSSSAADAPPELGRHPSAVAPRTTAGWRPPPATGLLSRYRGDHE